MIIDQILLLYNWLEEQQAISPLGLAELNPQASGMVDGRLPASLDGPRDHPPGSPSTTTQVNSHMAQSRYDGDGRLYRQ